VRLYIGLLHYPVYNKNRQKIASAVTTVDLHDLSRLAKTYGVKKFFVISPLKDQQRLITRVRNHWTVGHGSRYNRDRKEAFKLVALAPSLEKSLEQIERAEKKRPLVIATDASKQMTRALTYDEAARVVHSGELVYLIFGTAWGLTREILNKADAVLDPIQGIADYNHLSVRAAVAITLDRVAGRDYGEK
jgi:hypothetical protein